MIDKVIFKMHHGPPFVWYEEDATRPPNYNWGETERSMPTCDGCKTEDVPMLVIHAHVDEGVVLYFCKGCVTKFVEVFK